MGKKNQAALSSLNGLPPISRRNASQNKVTSFRATIIARLAGVRGNVPGRFGPQTTPQIANMHAPGHPSAHRPQRSLNFRRWKNTSPPHMQLVLQRRPHSLRLLNSRNRSLQRSVVGSKPSPLVYQVVALNDKIANEGCKIRTVMAQFDKRSRREQHQRMSHTLASGASGSSAAQKRR
jgi:hypothetical protein